MKWILHLRFFTDNDPRLRDVVECRQKNLYTSWKEEDDRIDLHCQTQSLNKNTESPCEVPSGGTEPNNASTSLV